MLREIHFINRISVEKAALVSDLVISPETASTNLWSKRFSFFFLRNREIRLDASNKQPQGLMERWWLVSSVRNSRIKASMRDGVNNWSSLSSIIWVLAKKRGGGGGAEEIEKSTLSTNAFDWRCLGWINTRLDDLCFQAIVCKGVGCCNRLATTGGGAKDGATYPAGFGRGRIKNRRSCFSLVKIGERW